MTIEIDDAYQTRAGNLCKDARSGSYSHAIAQSARGWWEDHSMAEMGAKLAGATGATYVGAIAAPAAIAALAAGGVALGALTFGVGPVIGLALGYAIKSGISEFTYQRASNRVKGAVQNGGRMSPEMLTDAIAKVLRKYDRVKRRLPYENAGVLAKIGHVFAHPQMSLRSARKATAQRTAFQTIKDEELYERLLEMRFYGQMTFNVVAGMIDTLQTRRDQLAGALQLTFAHTLRQVHFSGNHGTCTKCYGLSKAELAARMRKLIATRPPKTSGPAGTTQFSAAFSQSALARFQAEQIRLSHARKGIPAQRALRRLEQAAHGSDAVVDEHLDDGTALLKVADKVVSSGGKAAKTAASRAAIAGIDGGAPQTVVSAVGALGGAGAASGVGFAAEELTASVNNRLLRRKIFNTKEAALGLLESAKDSEAKAHKEIFKELTHNKESVKQATRLAQKCVHYMHKIQTMEEEYKATVTQISQLNSDFADSAFESCDQAYAAMKVGYYLFDNYNKYLVHLFYLEAVLLKADHKITSKLRGIPQGSLIGVARADWPKPPHLASRHNDVAPPPATPPEAAPVSVPVSA